MADQSTGKVEIVDTETGHSIATRYTSGVTQFDLDGFRMTLSGFADQGDFFDIGLNQSKSGDARNAEAIIALNRSTPERSSFQDDFRSIALGVGAQLVSGRLVEVSATSMRDAAVLRKMKCRGSILMKRQAVLWNNNKRTKLLRRSFKRRGKCLIHLWG